MKRWLLLLLALTSLSPVLSGCTAPGTETPERIALVRLDNTAGGQGMAMEVILRGTATTWSSDSPQLDMGEGIEVGGVTVSGDTYATAQIVIAADATLGRRDVTVQWGGDEVVIEDGFVVQTGGITIDPAYGRLGETVEVTLTGINTAFQDGYTQASFGEGVYVDAVVVASTTLATATISIEPSASPGFRDVTVFNGSNAWTAPQAFQIDRAAVTVTFDPDQGSQGQTLDFTMFGTNTTFEEGMTSVYLGPDIEIDFVDVIDPVNAFGRMHISNAAEIGMRDVIITSADEVLTIHDGFEVLETPVNLDLVQVSLGMSVSRNIVAEDCSVEESVSASVVFYQPLDISCGPPPIMAFPYDNEYNFDVSTDYQDCPSPRTFDAGEEVYFVSLDNTLTITLSRYVDSYSGFTYYVPSYELTLEDHPFNTPFRLEVPGSDDPEQVPAFTCDDCINAETGAPLDNGVIFTTIPKDITLVSPLLCDNFVHDPHESLGVEWTIGETYDVAGLSLVLQTSDETGYSRFLLVIPWDDGYWQWDPDQLALIPEGSGTLALADGRADVPEFYLPFGSGGKNQASTGLGWAGSMSLRSQ